MPSRKSEPKNEKIKELAYKRIAKKKPEILEKQATKEIKKQSTWPYILMMVVGLIVLFIGSAIQSWAIVITAMIISFYGTMKYSYITAKTKTAQNKAAVAQKKKKPKVLGEEIL